jgi:hypothetical protein
MRTSRLLSRPFLPSREGGRGGGRKLTHPTSSRTFLTGSSSSASTGQKSSLPSSVTPSFVKFAYSGTTAASLFSCPHTVHHPLPPSRQSNAHPRPVVCRPPFFPIFAKRRETYLSILDNQRSLGPMTDGMAAAQENLNVFYSPGSTRGHRASPWDTPEHPSHDNHNHREEVDTPFHSKASSWGGVPSTEEGPGIDFSTRARQGPPAKGFSSPSGTPSDLRDGIMRWSASSQRGAEENLERGGRDACRKAEEVMRLSRAWRLALLGGGTPPAPALQGEAAAASAATSTTPFLAYPFGEGMDGGAGGLRRGGKPSSSSSSSTTITITTATPSSRERECRIQEGGNGKGGMLASSRQGAGEDAEDFWHGKDDAMIRDASTHHGGGKDVDAISLFRHPLKEERHPPPPPIVPPSPPDAMPTEPCIKEWLRAHDLQCIESRLVAAGGGGVEGASLLTESDCDSISMGLSNIR